MGELHSFSRRNGYRFWRTLVLVTLDAGIVAGAFFLSFFLRFEGQIPPRYLTMYWQLLPLVLGVKILTFVLFGIYGFDWNYVSIEELLSTVKSCMASSSVFVALLFFLRDWPTFAGMPRSVLFIDFLLTLAGIGGIRFSRRIVQHALFRRGKKEQGRRTLIVGAGDAGEQLLRSILRERREKRFLPIGFVDDDPRKQGLNIHGVRVLGPRESLPELVHRKRIETVIIAMPSAPSRVIRETVELARKSGVKEIKIIPFLSELYTGEVSISEVREVQPEDLLGREPVSVDIQEVKGFIEGKRVLVTGAAGSIGSELCRQVLRFGPELLLALDVDETGLFNLERDLEKRFPVERFQIVVGDVRDRTKMKAVFKKYHPHVVFHAAAYKHVPIMEAFPDEAVKTNVFGTQITVEEACQAGVEAFVLISTDKAVNPVSVMGMTKRVAEMVILAVGNHSSTRCMAVRFGNVLGSRGSVLPLFLEQIRQRGPVTVTHPEMERYFMTTAEAVLLVLQAAAMGKGGEVFVLDMGKPVKIVDLAKELIRLHGLEPDKDIPIVFTGVRPGEKLKEEVLTAEEGVEATKNKQIFTARLSARIPEVELARYLQRLDELIASGSDGEVIKTLLREIIFGQVQTQANLF